MLLAHKIELRPTASQAEYLDKGCGSRRHCYNQLLNHFSQAGVKWSKTAAYQHYINVLRHQFTWYSEVSARVTRNAIDDLDNAFKHFFRRLKLKNKKAGFPQFKKKDVNDSFALREAVKFDVKGRWLRIEKLGSLIALRQPLRFSGQTKQVTLSKRAGKYFASILVETEDYPLNDTEREASVGVDLGVKSLATLSHGKVIPANQALKSNLKTLKRLQRGLAKKVKGSQRRAKAKLRVAKLHHRISRQRQAVLHELSDYLTKTFVVITLEDLNVRGMVKNHKLARAITDAGLGYLRQMIEYKAKLRNNTVIIADRFFPSSKQCSCCGVIKDKLLLSERVYHCEACGLHIDRDLNAALNLNEYGRHTLQADLKRTSETSQTTSVASLLTV